jgi:hypothetical protein
MDWTIMASNPYATPGSSNPRSNPVSSPGSTGLTASSSSASSGDVSPLAYPIGPYRSGYIQWNNLIAYYRVKSPSEYVGVVNLMQKAGLLKGNPTYAQVEYQWTKALEFSRSKSRGGAFISPLDAIPYMGRITGSDSGGSGGGRGGGGGTTTQTQRSVNISSAKDARALVNQSFQQSVGRDATDDEIKQFRSALNSEEKKNPSITKTTQTVSGSNNSVTSETSGGMDRGAYSLEQGKKAKDYGEFQTETTYMDALMSAISGGQ